MRIEDLPSPGFELISHTGLKKWKLMSLDRSIPLVKNTICFSCGSELERIVALISKAQNITMFIGCCRGCGIVTYIDRPNQEWLSNFYTNVWDKEPKSESNSSLKSIRASHFVPIAENIGLKKTDSILEIGTGYGSVVGYFAEHGYTNILGLENSSHRAKNTREMWKIEVLEGTFEGEDIQTELQKKKPVSFIFSAHVLEHTYNPDDFISKAARLQDEGGHIAISMPDFESETAINILLFYPHLHSFTLAGLKLLLEKHGYDIVDTSRSSEIELVVVGKKSRGPIRRNLVQYDYPAHALKKLTRELQLSSLKPDKPYHLTWKALHTKSRVRTIRQVLKKLKKLLKSFMQKEDVYVLNVRGITEKKTDTPIEIQFAKDIKLFYK